MMKIFKCAALLLSLSLGLPLPAAGTAPASGPDLSALPAPLELARPTFTYRCYTPILNDYLMGRKEDYMGTHNARDTFTFFLGELGASRLPDRMRAQAAITVSFMLLLRRQYDFADAAAQVAMKLDRAEAVQAHLMRAMTMLFLQDRRATLSYLEACIKDAWDPDKRLTDLRAHFLSGPRLTALELQQAFAQDYQAALASYNRSDLIIKGKVSGLERSAAGGPVMILDDAAYCELSGTRDSNSWFERTKEGQEIYAFCAFAGRQAPWVKLTGCSKAEPEYYDRTRAVPGDGRR
jgi:hypothetical protein